MEVEEVIKRILVTDLFAEIPAGLSGTKFWFRRDGTRITAGA